MKRKVSDLSGVALDWAVAKCDGYHATIKPTEIIYTHPTGEWHHNGNWKPSVSWVQGGPIIERERISVLADHPDVEGPWLAEDDDGVIHEFGQTPLVAAMRCFVASKIGDEVDVPDELCEEE